MNNNIDYASKTQVDARPGPFLAKVVSHLDPTYMGGLEVEILRPAGNSQSSGNLHHVKYMSPFYGITSVAHVDSTNDYNSTQKSYGMWMIPPDPGTTVVVIFIDGDPKRGYWIGCVQDDNMNFMVPGLAASSKLVDGKGRQPAAEYNKSANSVTGDPEQIKKPVHPFAAVLEAQGLLADDTRGITTSSARRETPSAVFGISTPGPLDKRSGAKKGKIGKKDSEVTNAFVSRLGGSTFVMDDGDDKFIRKGHPSTSPPVYASLEQGETGGDATIPHNELIRIRTRTGHQILLHNSEDLIYIGNARGTTWIELTSNGKIDVYAADSVSVHTKADYNVTADGNINFTAQGNINFKSAGNIVSSAAGNYEIKASGNGIISVSGVSSISSSEHRENAGHIYMNSSAALSASDAIEAPRVPQAEPWAGHENLHDSALTYSTATDTFAKVSSSKG